MKNLENSVGEEYLTVLQLKTLELAAKESETDLSGAKKILERTIEDERRHKTIMTRIEIIITKQKMTS